MNEFILKVFDFKGVNPELTHNKNLRVELPEDSSYLNVVIEFELPENLLEQYDDLDYIVIEDGVIKYSENVVHNHITQSVFLFVKDNYENEDLIVNMKKLLDTLHLWKIS